MTEYSELADVIERLVNGTSPPVEWDAYTLGKTYTDPFLVAVQRRMISVSFDFPPGSSRGYTNAAGLRILKDLVVELRSRASHSDEPNR
jgi:hypothetical protein